MAVGSRSKHTRPDYILAAERVRAPYEPRGRGDRSALCAEARALKREGILPDVTHVFDVPHPAIRTASAPLPRVLLKRPREGFCHPALRRDIERLLRFLGEQYTYGVRRIVLASAGLPGRASGSHAHPGSLPVGALLVPGTIILYEQPAPP